MAVCLLQNAGGLAISGTTPVLDLQPEAIHERCPMQVPEHACGALLGCYRCFPPPSVSMHLQTDGFCLLQFPGQQD